ncbi:prolyl oligopeptidase family serine peptidase [Gracilibacillus sp. S3-1-1]|uniref:Prolyl oligopeptidase family serine peptidase n=1 Tax=Gracilibacillus pellucidus TaxID=3095368 RepID=A0ACC6M801_9BACI|nr:prolyl oligopeptidase family serine peptidase [Gracilibacillus sp. S3-1-1]MDX8047113.1 prolyl oligopeptidase family serine peptidase [Gracilibacillus sp. S3-1-1]
MLQKTIILCSMIIMTIGFSLSVSAKDSNGYYTITEIQDWGPAITKIIVEVGKPIPTGAIDQDTFSVHVTRSDDRVEESILEEGYRQVTNAYVADKQGNPAKKMGKYAVLELEIGPDKTLGAPMHYVNSNNWIDVEYVITQEKSIEAPYGEVNGLTITSLKGDIKQGVEKFTTDRGTYAGIDMSYASYTPETKSKEKPLIVWLHGGGEGGTDATIPLGANKAINLASESIQDYFDRAYVLVPQAPTKWMDGVTADSDGTSKYTESLMELIEAFVQDHKDIDPERIYIGGASNGGYMTLVMTREYPDYFAAAVPVCEGLNDSLLSDQDILTLAKTPTWFVTAENDPTLDPALHTLPTYERMASVDEANVHLTLFDNVVDQSGLYTNEDNTPYEYAGHWSWIYVFNDQVLGLFEWLAEQEA